MFTENRWAPTLLSLATLGAAAGLCIWQWGENQDLVAGALRLDDLGLAGSLIAIASAAFVVPMTLREPAADRAGHADFLALLLGSVLGMVILATSQNLVTLFVGLELLSVPLYVLCGSELSRRESLESGLKYLIVGSLGSATLLYGLAFIYGASGSTDFTGIREGLQGLFDDPLVLVGIGLAGHGARVQGLARAFSPVDARRLRGRADPGHGVHGGGDEGGGLLRLRALLRRRARGVRRATGTGRWRRSPSSRSSSETSARWRRTRSSACSATRGSPRPATC